MSSSEEQENLLEPNYVAEKTIGLDGKWYMLEPEMMHKRWHSLMCQEEGRRLTNIDDFVDETI